jgi:hypothetical protein
MSSGYQQYFTNENIDMLDRVLSRAGIGDISTTPGLQDRLYAARFLIAAFQNGITDEGALYFALVNRQATAGTVPRGYQAGPTMQRQQPVARALRTADAPSKAA